MRTAVLDPGRGSIARGRSLAAIRWAAPSGALTPSGWPVDTNGMAKRRDGIGIAKRGGWLLVGGAYGLWELAGATDPALSWIVWCAMSLPLGALLLTLGLRSH